MNTTRTLKWGLVTAAAACAVVAAMPGCELLVDFDRSKIPSEGGAEDVTVPDGPTGDSAPETGTETSTDAPADAPSETTTEAGKDAPSEAAHEGGMDGGPEAEASSAMMGISPSTGGPASAVEIGSPSATFAFTVTNSGTGTSGTPSVTISGTNMADFSQTNTCTAGLAAAGTCTVTVTFTPSINGAESATLNVSATPGGSAAATLTGTGAGLTIAPTTGTFGPTGADGSSSASQTFTVTNSGPLASGTPAVTLMGPNASSFGVTNNTCSAALASLATCTFDVTFTPQATGSLTASAQVTASPGGTASANLTGTGN
jgi:hypothetical protein